MASFWHSCRSPGIRGRYFAHVPFVLHWCFFNVLLAFLFALLGPLLCSASFPLTMHPRLQQMLATATAERSSASALVLPPSTAEPLRVLPASQAGLQQMLSTAASRRATAHGELLVLLLMLLLVVIKSGLLYCRRLCSNGRCVQAS